MVEGPPVLAAPASAPAPPPAPMPAPAVPATEASPAAVRLDLGPAPIVDFDGTLAHLRVDWAALRARLGVDRIDDLWQAGGDRDAAWAAVTAAETAGVDAGEAVDGVVRALLQARRFAVLTSNSARAVERFCSRRAGLGARLALVVGRERLGGPKTDFRYFRAGFAACVAATAGDRGTEAVVYAGDQAYELGFARHLGAHAVDVTADRRLPWACA